MTRYIVATTDEVPVGGRKIVTVAGREVGIFNLGGRYYAMRNRCPHEAGPVCLGQQLGFLTSTTPGEYNFVDDGAIIRCPWHQWEFDIRTGQSWFDPARVRTRAYAVHVERGATLAGAVGDAAESTDEIEGASEGRGERRPGPYVAEVYPVSVEREYIVVELGG